MAESVERLRERIEVSTRPGFRDRLLDKGLARGMIWRDGMLPRGSPPFPDSLTEDLLDYAHSVLNMALRLRAAEPGSDLERPFLVAGEAIEAAVHRDADGSESGFHRVSAAVAFHLARYSARAYSMLPAAAGAANLAPTESALVQLLRRRLDDLHALYSDWLLDGDHDDARIAERLRDDEDFGETDASSLVIISAFMRGLALFDHAITTGEASSASLARERLQLTAEVARDLNAVSHWWTATLALHLLDELWGLSLYERVPLLPPDDDDAERWNSLRRSYVQRLRAGKRSAIELWPSQLEAVRRAVDPADDLVVALPTSAGKTRIAELCILRALASEKRVVYVTPLRALSAQVERDLAETFAPLGLSVSSLYGSAGVESGDAVTLREGEIVVSTPEKLDFALRNDNTIIDDVGLIVLDEGHMFGPNEREVRYEALVQRLLRRNDAATRRIVCLSALFPRPDEMSDLVAWIRQDEPGDPIHSLWRPTRQRFGVLRWTSDAARLDVRVEDESPFVPRYIEAFKPPAGSRRRKVFPSDKNELALAAAWRFVEQDKDVLVYCPLRISVEALGRLALKCIEHGVLQSRGAANQRVRNAMLTGSEWLGDEHPAVRCLEHGIALHHGGLPRPFLSEVERLLRAGDCGIAIASPTLAQGLNLIASVLLVPSIWRSGKIIRPVEFANVAGRAGRAFVDVEGLVVHVIHEPNLRKLPQAIRNWEELLRAAKAPRVGSGILQLAALIFLRISAAGKIPFGEVLEYVAGNDACWFPSPGTAPGLDKLKEWAEAHPTDARGIARVFDDAFWVARLGTDEEKKAQADEKDWESDVASLDAAILALLEAETSADELGSALDDALAGSLFTRQVAQQDSETQRQIAGIVVHRARSIWAKTSSEQRMGYHAAGIGLTAGQFLDANLDVLVRLLMAAEVGVADGDPNATSDALVDFAELVFQTAPFQAPKALPANWKDALRAWMHGHPSAVVIEMCGGEGVDLIQEALAYRLPWAVEAVRVHASNVAHDGADELTGLAALAVETGSTNRSVIVLVRSGLNTREGAATAVISTGATFDDRVGMLMWLGSHEVEELNSDESWPTPQSRHAWVRFYEGKTKGDRRKWTRETQRLRVEWADEQPKAGTHVVLEPGDTGGLVLSPAFEPLGKLVTALKRPRRDIVQATVGEKPGTVAVECFGPLPENSELDQDGA
jgi:hypothetical protein